MSKAPHAGVIRRARMAFEDEFVTLRNAWVRDERLSFRARGILAFLMSHDSGYTTSVEQLSRLAAEGRDATRTAVRELEQLGYLVRRRKSDGTRFTIEWELLDPFQPVDNSGRTTGNPSTGNPSTGEGRTTGNPSTGNPSIEENQTKKSKTSQGDQQNADGAPVDSSRSFVCAHCSGREPSPTDDELALRLCSPCYWTSSVRRARVAQLSRERFANAGR